jgi:hypothetical protein
VLFFAACLITLHTLVGCLQNCADSAFCTRLRGNASEAFVIVSESVKVEGPRVTATVANTQDANATFFLVLTAYGDTLRLWINEAPEKGRFEVPDVLLPGLEQREQVRCKQAAARQGQGERSCAAPTAVLCKSLSGSTAVCCSSAAAVQQLQLRPPVLNASPRPRPLSSACPPGNPCPQQEWVVVKKAHTKLKLRLGEAELELRFAPAALDISVGGAPVLAWNAGKQFIFEHLRQKQEGDPEGWWGENYKSHHDSKPKGPTAISLDLGFPGFSHLYGLPERATSLALKPTRGPDGPLSGAWWNTRSGCVGQRAGSERMCVPCS